MVELTLVNLFPFSSPCYPTLPQPTAPPHTHTHSLSTFFSTPLLIITHTAGTLHFISSILSLQGWQAGHKLSWRWGWKLEEIVMKISSVCRSGRSCSCHQPRAGGITLGQRLCTMCAGRFFSLCICAGTWTRVNAHSVLVYMSLKPCQPVCGSAFVPVCMCVCVSAPVCIGVGQVRPACHCVEHLWRPCHPRAPSSAPKQGG